MFFLVVEKAKSPTQALFQKRSSNNIENFFPQIFLSCFFSLTQKQRFVWCFVNSGCIVLFECFEKLPLCVVFLVVWFVELCSWKTVHRGFTLLRNILFSVGKEKTPTQGFLFLKNEDKGVNTYVSANKIRTTVKKCTLRNVLFRRWKS